MVSEIKIELVKGLTKNIKNHPVVGVVNLENLPAQQLQVMRATLSKRGVLITTARKRLLARALKDSKLENVEQLTQKLKGIPALLFTADNPFSLYATIQKNKSEAPAKAGQIAPRDIVVKAGATSFAPGPIISELAAVGIKTKVENGKLSIISDVVVVKEGKEISSKVAETLKRLDIKPMEVGLDLVAVWENGTVFNAKQLHIDEAEFKQNIIKAAQWAINLAMEASIINSETVELLLQKAHREAKAVGIEGAVLTEHTHIEILAKSEAQAQALKNETKL